jgi:hypothetical protein
VIKLLIALLISMRVVRVLQAASGWKKLNSVEIVGEVVQEQGPFSKLCVILVGN